MLATDFSDDKTGYFEAAAIGNLTKPENYEWYRGSPRLFIYSRQSGGIQSNLHDEFTGRGTLDQLDDSELDEIEDQIEQLPKEWANKFYNKEYRRRSCELSKGNSPCVRKVIEHLQQLESKVLNFAVKFDGKSVDHSSSDLQYDDMIKDDDNAAITSRSYSRGSTTSQKDDRSSRLMRFSSAATTLSTATELDTESLTSNDTLATHSTRYRQDGNSALKIVGVGASMPIKCEETQVAVHLNEHPVNQVIEEVLMLLGRLENERLRNQRALKQQTSIVEHLKHEIGKLAKNRLIELPKAVQNEHETCALDIMELRWHNSYRERKLERLKDRVSKAEYLNNRIKEELAYCRENHPLVEKKLDSEKKLIVKLRGEKNAATEELAKVLAKLEDARALRNEAQIRIDKERKIIEAEINEIEQELRKVEKNLEKCKKQQLKHTHNINSSQKKIEENETEFRDLEFKLESIITTEERQQAKVEILSDQIVDCEKEKTNLEKENENLRNKYEKHRMESETEISRGDYQNKKVSKATETTKKKNVQLASEIESLKKQIRKLSKETDHCKKEIERHKSDLVRVDQQIGFCMSEVRVLQMDNDDKVGRLQREEERVTSLEDSLRGSAEALRKQLQEETRAKTLLQARIAADTAELAKSEADYKRRQERATRKVTSLEQALVVLSDQVEKSNETLRKRRRMQNDVEQQLAEVLDKLNREENGYKSELDELEPQEAQLKADVLAWQKKLDRLRWTLDVVNQRLEDTESSISMLEKTIEKALPKNFELKTELKDLKQALTTEQSVQQALKDEIKGIEYRNQTYSNSHTNILDERTAVLNKIKSDLAASLEKNSTLTHDYRLLQKESIERKSNLTKILETTVTLEKSACDHKQLKDLQSMMTISLKRYYELRGTVSKGNLTTLNYLSSINSDRLVKLREDLQHVIDRIDSYLDENAVETQQIIRQAFATAAGYESIDAVPIDQRIRTAKSSKSVILRLKSLQASN